MKYFVVSFFCFYSLIAYGQDKSNFFSKAINYIDSSKVIKRQLVNMVAEQDQNLLNKSKSLVFICPLIQFENLSESQSSIKDSANSWNLKYEEIINSDLYKRKNNFTSYTDSFLCNLKHKTNIYYPFYASFSNLTGRILPVTIYYNEASSKLCPCYQLNAPKFGQALLVLLVFDPDFKKVQQILSGYKSLN